MEDRARRSIGQCYDEGVVQMVENVGEVVEDERGKRFNVNESYDAIKERWLKERTVIFIFQDEARDLSRSVKEDLIRAHEDGWMSRRLFDPSIRRGRVKFEGPNVISYVAKAIEVATWLVQKATIKLALRGKEYSVLVKPWMTKPELKELKLREAETNFWIVALRVPLDAMCYLPSAAEGLFGGVKMMHPLEVDRVKPKLMNIKLDMDPSARFRVENSLTIESPKGELWTLDSHLAEALTQAGVKWLRLDAVREANSHELEAISLTQEVTALLLLSVNEKLPDSLNLRSKFLLTSLTKNWRSSSQQSHSGSGSRQSPMHQSPVESVWRWGDDQIDSCIQYQAMGTTVDG
ncbi:hypothetical protein CBR_g41280 [Chara braunii]|uniref:Uncharacterized protein n=1 Tax=Chara braunii TaxID=69332 RepID=A0A388LVD4_CHABU|nr:hypothetical protein CBR_g41280 [Chara braunii]|eukprot:GBG86286.1 hypothetical protein CBR_g41280 [Chara braunii]